jgi:hypothetical protein
MTSQRSTLCKSLKEDREFGSIYTRKSRDSVSRLLGRLLAGQPKPVVRLPSGARDFSLSRFQTGYGAYSAFCSVGVGDSFPRSKAAGA